MNIYFTIYMMLQFIGLGITMERHGKPKEEKYNAGSYFIGLVIEVILVFFAIKTGF